jgi:serine/threonine protein kinase/tetratricopeptide (TPR) repeat protein
MGSNGANESDLTTTSKCADSAMIGKTLSHFKVLDVLGTGGMGVVYKARDTKLLRQVAIKVLSSERTTENQKKRFLQEARAASALNHRGIVAIYDFGSDHGLDFIAMESVDGESLAKKIPPEGLPFSEAKTYAQEIADAMAAAHSAGIVHRDLKPQNLMITKEGRIKILDFGIAKLNPVAEFDMQAQTISKSLTGIGGVIGTLAYMSPEQALGDPVDERSDIFSFGVVLYEMLTGARPFEGGDESSLLHKLHFDDPAPVSSIREDVPVSVEYIVRKALAKRPQDRQQSMAEVCRELEDLSIDETKIGQMKKTADLGPKKIVEAGSSRDLPDDTALSRVFLTLAKKPKQGILAAGLVIFFLAAIVALGLTWRLKNRGRDAKSISEDLIAVLPFENIGGDKALDAACIGLTESLANGLGQVQELKESLKVVPAGEVRQSNVRSAAQAGEQFGAGLVIAGSLQRQDDNVRMNLSLVKGATQLAAATGVVSQKELDSLERQALLKTVGLLRRQFDTFAETKSTIAPEAEKGAREFFKEGMGLLEDYVRRSDKKENIDKAIEAFQRAQALDSTYAPAYAGLSRAYWRKYIDNEDAMWIEQAEQTARRAVELNPELSMARVSLGIALRQKGQDDEAVKEFEQALKLDPFSSDANQGLADVWRSRGDLQKALGGCKDALDLSPKNRELFDLLGSVYYQSGNYEEAVEAF